MAVDELGSASLHAVSQLVGLQLFSRAFTFALNQALVRVASPEVFGTATVQFELLLSTILFLAREGVRNALLRTPGASSSRNNNNEQAKVANVAVLPILLGGPLALLATISYHTLAAHTTRSQPHFSLAVILYAIAALLELLAEPLYIRALTELKVNVRVRAEACAIAAKTFGTFILLVLCEKEWSLVAFAGGQIAYGGAVLGVFLFEYGTSSRLWLTKVSQKVHDNIRTSYFDSDLLKLSLSMTSQSVFKHILTEGDRFLVSKFSKLEDQGGYAVATNYGSLVARIIFQPIEESSRLFFSKLLSSKDASSKKSAEDASSEDKSKLKQAGDVVHLVILLYVHLGLIFITFGPPYVPTLLSLVLPTRYMSTSAPLVLQAYCVYLPIMALNGFLEAFVSSTATPADLAAQSRFMGICSVLFVVGAVTLSEGFGMRETGLVYANVINLGARAIFGWYFLKRYFEQQHHHHAATAATSLESETTPIIGKAELLINGRKCLPPRAIWLTSLIVGCIVRLSAMKYGSFSTGIKTKGFHLIVGSVQFAIWICICWNKEKDIFINVYRYKRSRSRE